MAEAVVHPSHYNVGKIEVIDAIEDWKLGFNDGNAIKYIARHRNKGKAVEDLKKALFYVARELRAIHNVSMTDITAVVATVVKNDTIEKGPNE